MGLGGHDAYRLRHDATVTLREDGALVLRVSRFRLVLDDLGVGRRSTLLRMAETWTTDTEIGELVAAVEGETRILQVQVLVRGLLAHSWLGRRRQFDGRTLLELIPRGLGSNSLPPAVGHDPRTRYRLSRFAQLRSAGGRLVAETPLSTLAVAVPDPAVVGALTRAAAAEGIDLGGFAGGLGADEELAGRVLDDLLTARVLISATAAEQEHEAAPLAPWSPAELALHERSRPGRHILPVGGTYPLRGRVEPEPLARTFEGAESVPLPEPDLALVAKTDPSLTEAIAARRTIRRHDAEAPITVAQLAEFLHRVQRTTVSGEEGGAEVGQRPYPMGGALCELEVYALVHRCEGLERGVYHYEAAGHRLERLGPLEGAATRALEYVTASARFTEPPQVYLVITARVGRVMWKYEGFGYALILKHAGVLTELMYLVATAMGLAPCAVGAGDATAFARAAGVDPLAEPAIADFVLGSCPQELGLCPQEKVEEK
ncbi:hypothetical protein CcI49_14865 [Frankia sp. CcI49]|uniref:SagB family peptide dehydrogenase n=1 Tax=unclassified Frankia TaxID=2632575 RepID=UPI0006C9F486|nr:MULTISPECIES: SagB family peptide dehydrogenase [unclassified Frankia]ONH59984.1 hypothetical protein CcI49_14865 [Frankia sp. CcI49]